MTAAAAGTKGELPLAQMRRWYLAGESNASIGRRLGLHQSMVRRALIAGGVTMRSRREQVALTDQQTGVRPPSCEELGVAYVSERRTMAELAERYGLTEARVLLLLRRCGIERRRGGIRPERADAERSQRRPPELVDRIVELYRSGLSSNETAARLGVHRQVVTDELRRCGVTLRGHRKLPPDGVVADGYIGGETCAEIAATYDVTANAVLRALQRAGIERRPAVVRTRPVAEADVVRCYVVERLSLQATARRLAVSVPRVRAVIGRLGVLRAGFDLSSVDRARFERRYADGATLAELADEFDLTRQHARVAIRSFELPRRLPRTHTSLPIGDRQLAALIAAGHSDGDIAARYDVAVWAATRRRRHIGLRRPPPNRVRPPLSRARLARLLAAGTTRADIATMYRVGLATVTRWCTHYGIEVVGASRPSGGHGELDPGELRRLYIDEEWSTRQIGDHLGLDATLITFALHSHRIPVRRGGHRSPNDAVMLLDALYGDPDVVAVLERHHVPLRRRAGRLAQRFPRPAPLDAVLADELYRDVGLSTTHISLLTGHSATNVVEVLRRHGIPTRSANRSPWHRRTIIG